jgi:hypothetical protein
VSGKGEAVDHTSQGLSVGSLQWINGTYAACLGHADGDAWSLSISGATAMTNPTLGVAMRDPTCQLTVTALMADTLYESSPSITLSTAYQTTASSLASRIGGVLQPVAFYANAEISATDFATDFIVTILYSDDPQNATASTGATYAQFAGAATATQVPAPDYTADVSGMVVQTDALDDVATVSGSIGLTAGSQTGEQYVVTGPVDATFAAVDAAYSGGTQVAMAAAIPAASFLTAGDSLPTMRTVIISHTVSGVVAYETIQITFNHP